MKNHITMISLLRIAAVCAAFLAGSNAFAAIFFNLTFDENTLALNTTGTFTLSGSASNPGTGSSSGWQMMGPGETEGWFTLQAVTFSTNGANVTLDGNAYTPNMAGSQILWMGGGNGFLIAGPGTNFAHNNLLEIGNGTTDYISGTFRVSNSSNIGSLSIADLNVAINNVSMTAAAVPEPAAFAALAGFAVLGFVGLRRRREAA